MAVTKLASMSANLNVGYFWTLDSATPAGAWLVAFHGWNTGNLADMAVPNQTPGTWHLLASVDAGPGLPKWKVWANKIPVGGALNVGFNAPPGGGDNITRLYVLTGTRPYSDPERVFCAGAVASATPSTTQTVPLYAPDDSGYLMGAWLTGAVVDYTTPASMDPGTERDGTASTCQGGDETLTAHGTGVRTATASAAGPWAAVTVVARDATGSVTFPNQRLQMRAEIAPGGSPDADPATWAGLWTDITADVYARQPVAITRGRSDEASSVGPSSMTLELNNAGGKYTRLNPNSPFYGKLSKNTPARLWVNPGSGWECRYTGFVAEWPPRQQGGDVDQHMPIQASGIVRRMNQGKALRSPLFRAITATGGYSAYWPLETDPSSGIVGGRPMRTIGSSSFTSDGPAGSAGAMTFDAGAYASAPVVGMPNVGGWRISWWLEIPADFANGDVSNMVYWVTPGSVADQWFAYVSESTPAQLVVYNFQYGVSEFAVNSVVDFRGRGPVLVSVWAQPTGGGDVQFGFDLIGDGFSDGSSTLSVGNTLNPITSMGINTHMSDIGNPTPKGNISHLLVVADPAPVDYDPTTLFPAGQGYAGELAADRIRRLADEENAPIVVVGDDGTSEPMGPQPVAKLLDILQDCETADGGQLYEKRDGRLAYQVRSARYNATPTLILDHPSGHLAPPFEPQDDDQQARNDVTASRPDGGAYRVVDTDSVAEIGLYDAQVTVNVYSDDQLDDQAGWRVHLGTGTDYRYPSISPNLNGKASALIPGWLALDAGQAVAVTNPSSDLPPGQIDTFAEGYAENLDTVSWTATINASPGKPWKVGVLDDVVLGRADTDGSILAADATATAASLYVSVTAGPGWTVDPAEFPFDLAVGGETIRVTGITAPAVINTDSGFDNPANWTGSGGTLTVSGSLGKITPNGTSSTVQVLNTPRVAVTPGVPYVASTLIQNDVTRIANLIINWHNGSGTLISTSTLPVSLTGGVLASASFTAVAPVGAATAAIGANMTGTPPATNVMYLDGMTLSTAWAFSVTRSINGVSKAHSAGEDVRLATPMILAL